MGVIKIFITAITLFLPFAFLSKKHMQKTNRQNNNTLQMIISLPEPAYKSGTSVEEALLKRRSVRDYKKEPLQLKEISQLLWAAQGITSAEEGGRTAPSAGALYPLELYVVIGNINTLTPGVYHYRPPDHSLERIADGDKRKLLSAAALMQGAVNKNACVIVIAADYKRTTGKYFERGKRYVHMEAGHAAQNIYLQAVSLNIGTVVIGAFTDSLVKQIIHLPKNEEPLYLMPVGKI
jgi:SagB-type dehydrogenase family enzyme